MPPSASTARSVMPGDANVADARRRMEQRLARARGAGSGLLPALQALAQAREASPGREHCSRSTSTTARSR